MTIARASVLEQFNAPLQAREYPLPSRLEPGAALVCTEMAGICGTDVHLWKGQLPISLPVILGHETVGRIEQLGDGLENDWTGKPLKIGDRVTWTSTTSCGQCYYCAEKQQPTRCTQRRAYGIGYRCDQPPHLLGGYAQFHYLKPRSNIFRIPDDLTTEAVIGAGCALITAIHGVERICAESMNGVAPDRQRGGMPVLPSLWRDSVVIQGAGPVGIAALAVARKAGAGRVMVIGGPNHRLELAGQFGADRTIDIDELREPEARIGAVREFTGRHGADIVLECAGLPAAVAEGLELCRDGGKYLVLAGPLLRRRDRSDQSSHHHAQTTPGFRLVVERTAPPRCRARILAHDKKPIPICRDGHASISPGARQRSVAGDRKLAISQERDRPMMAAVSTRAVPEPGSDFVPVRNNCDPFP